MSGRKDLCLLAGHAPRKDTALEAAVAVAGVPSPKVAYIGAASGDNFVFFTMMKSAFRNAGAGSVELVKLTGRKPDLEKALGILDEADCIHVVGGDVEAGMSILNERGIIPKLRELFDGGKAFSGLSAGSIMLGAHWISWKDPDDDDSIEIFPCLGFAPFPCDTHAEDDDFSELQALLSRSTDSVRGYGIPSGTGLRLRQDGTIDALAGTVFAYEKRGSVVLRCGELKAR